MLDDPRCNRAVGVVAHALARTAGPLALALATLLACGGGGPATMPPATAQDVRIVQVHEQSIAEAQAGAERGECSEDALRRAGEGARSICRIAESSSDVDLDARCRRAGEIAHDLAARRACHASSAPASTGRAGAP